MIKTIILLIVPDHTIYSHSCPSLLCQIQLQQLMWFDGEQTATSILLLLSSYYYGIMHQ
jgi:hypothetical protein